MIDRSAINSSLSTVNKKSGVNSLIAVGHTAQIERESVEGATIGLTINQSAGGFISITASTNENQTITLEPSVAKMTNGVPGITLTKTSGKKTEITTLTGKATSDGFLNATITHASPKGIEKTLINVTPASTDQVKAVVSSTSSNPAVAQTLVNVDVSQKVSTSVATVSKKSNTALNNPFGSIGTAITAAGTSFGNIIGNVVGTITGTIKKGSTISVGTEIPATTAASAGTTQISASVSQSNLLRALTNIAEDFTKAVGIDISGAGQTGVASRSLGLTSGLDAGVFVSSGSSLNVQEELPPIITANGDTNISGIVKSDNLIPEDVKPTTPPYTIGDGSNKWRGAFTPDDYEFTYVNTKEELELELRNAPREITTLTVWWTFSAKNQNSTARQFHDLHAKYLGKSLTTDDLKAKYGGLTYNYLIRRDGSIQRGRPLSVDGQPGTWANYGVSIAFVGGINGNFPTWNMTNAKANPYIYSTESYTAQQWEAFDTFTEVWFKAIPGGQILGTNEWNPDTTGNQPGFIPSEWAEAKYGKVSAYTDNDNPVTRQAAKKGSFSPLELNRKVPVVIVQPTKAPRSTTPPPAPREEESPNVLTGLVAEKTLDEKTKLQIEYDDLQTEISKNRTDLLSYYNKLSKLPYEDPVRINLTNKYIELEALNNEKIRRSLEVEKLLSDGFNRTEDTLNALNNAKATLANKKLKLIQGANSGLSINALSAITKEIDYWEAETDRLTNLYNQALIADARRVK